MEQYQRANGVQANGVQANEDQANEVQASRAQASDSSGYPANSTSKTDDSSPCLSKSQRRRNQRQNKANGASRGETSKQGAGASSGEQHERHREKGKGKHRGAETPADSNKSRASSTSTDEPEQSRRAHEPKKDDAGFRRDSSKMSFGSSSTDRPERHRGQRKTTNDAAAGRAYMNATVESVASSTTVGERRGSVQEVEAHPPTPSQPCSRCDGVSKSEQRQDRSARPQSRASDVNNTPVQQTADARTRNSSEQKRVHFEGDIKPTPSTGTRNYSYPMNESYQSVSPRHRTYDGVAHVHPEVGHAPHLQPVGNAAAESADEERVRGYYTRSSGPLFSEHGYHPHSRSSEQQRHIPKTFSLETVEEDDSGAEPYTPCPNPESSFVFSDSGGGASSVRRNETPYYDPSSLPTVAESPRTGVRDRVSPAGVPTPAYDFNLLDSPEITRRTHRSDSRGPQSSSPNHNQMGTGFGSNAAGDNRHPGQYDYDAQYDDDAYDDGYANPYGKCATAPLVEAVKYVCIEIEECADSETGAAFPAEYEILSPSEILVSGSPMIYSPGEGSYFIACSPIRYSRSRRRSNPAASSVP